jgi:hypothetical protein
MTGLSGGRMPSSKQPAWLGKLRCPRCAGASRLKALPARPGRWGAWGRPGVKCLRCRESYPVVDGGILRLVPKGDMARYAYWETLHASVDLKKQVALYERRFAYPQGALDEMFCLPRLSRRAGWGPYASSLELGCGWGIYSLSLAKAGLLNEIWLLDISVSALKGAQAAFRHFGFQPFLIQGEIHRLPFQDAAFEVSLSGGLYEHFVGAEQEALVAENCRISRKVLNELPVGSLAYWIYRKFFTWWWGNWPFGFEQPLSRRRLGFLYENAGAKVRAWDYYNLGTAAMLAASERLGALRPLLAFKPFFFYLLRHDLCVAVECRVRD